MKLSAFAKDLRRLLAAQEKAIHRVPQMGDTRADPCIAKAQATLLRFVKRWGEPDDAAAWKRLEDRADAAAERAYLRRCPG